MEIKYLSRKKWSRILERKYVHEYIEDTCFQGEIALIHLIKVTHPRSSNLGGKEITWIDNNYYWLELAPVHQNYWLTIMFNEKKEIQQYYFDITDKNVINDKDSYFYDLYLDVVVSNKQIYVLDEDELENAYSQNEINKEQYEKAINMKNQLVYHLENHYEDLEKLCYKYFNRLREKMYDLCNE